MLNEAEVEVLFHDRHGNGKWTTVRESPLHDEQGALVGLLHRIVGLRRPAPGVAELTQSRRQLEDAQRIARLGSWVYDVAADASTLLGGARSPAPATRRAQRSTYFLGLIHPDDVEATAGR